MIENNLLYIPLKQASPINLGEKLGQVIDDKYFQPSNLFSKDLIDLTNIRNEIAKLKNIEISNKEIDLLYNYLTILSDFLEKKFPDDAIEFGWSDLLTHQLSTHKLRSFKFEKLNNIFQLGAIYSQLALKESRHTDEGLKKSCNLFQLSSGCFQYISNLVDKYNTIHFSSDFRNETVLSLMNLMLAQAQETIWQKALNNTTIKDSVIARLSLSVSEYYSKTVEFGKLSDFIKLEWLNHMDVKKFHFLAASHFRLSNVALDSAEYGVQVAHLRLASKFVDLAFKHKKYVSQFVIEDLNGLSEVVKTKLRTAEKDNDLIYLKIVPNEVDLKKIEGASMVKPIYSDKFNNEPSKEYFKELIPYVIVNVAQAMRERQDDFINSRFHEPIISLNNMLNQFVTERGLPASIDSIQQPENIPESIINHSKEILNLGGIELIEKIILENQNLSIECNNLVEECNKRIQLDSNEDDMLRKRQGTARWNRPSTAEAAKELIFKIEKMYEYLDQAKSGDSIINQKFYNIKSALEVYVGGQKSLNSYIPNSTYSSLDPEVLKKINYLRDLLSQITTLEEERKTFLNSLEIKSRDNNILPKLIEKYKANPKEINDLDANNISIFEEIYVNHLKSFNIDIDYLNKSKETQIELENNINLANNEFIKSYQATKDSTTIERENSLQTLEIAYNQYLEIISNLNEGSKFYHDFLTKGNNVLKDCEDYLYKRRLESRDLEISLNTPPTPSQSNEAGKIVSPKSSKPIGGVWNPDAGIKFG
ncbi:unnamed protein product [Candida verbasci]|uniref:BRO1 domain-containing protein n=1 Tax=Candida verbasci TaxID=1227364 RepID=A0A9W4TUK9_9ASCO|nr:unnamed protein product [Candida verbasci]